MHDCWYYTGGCFHYTQANCFKWQLGCGNCPKKKTDTPAYFLDKSSQILADRKRLFDAIPNLTVTGVSNWICEESNKGIFRDKQVVTIHNGVDTNIFRPTSLKEIEATDDLNKVEETLKGHFTIMGLAGKWIDPINRDAFFYIIKQMQPSDRFLLFGSNDGHVSLLNNISISKEQRERLITFGYTTNRKQLAALYTMADVFINCTHEESFSLINVEPQACGTPVVTYANTGAQETVDNQCGFGVKTGEYHAMWEIITQIRRNGKGLYSDDCIHWVKGKFDIQDNYQKYLDLYAEE
jgi:glycosyltransferase involved in cell wall biosynthesis